MATTIPDKLYVTIQYRKDTTEGLLGFASPYTADAAFRKRKETQDKWAYGYGTDFVIADDDGVSSGPNATNQNLLEFFATNCNPRIVKNEPVSGFQIAKTVRRHGWSGSGNVVWRITDPRGYDLEISSENFARIVDCTTMINGVIQGPCVWGREGSSNVLLPVNSEPYKLANKHTTLVNNKLSLRDITIGDHVVLIDKSSSTGSRDGIYLGRIFIVCTEDIPIDSKRYDCAQQVLAGLTTDTYAFRDPNDKEIYLVNKPVIGAKIKDCVENTTVINTISELNTILSSGNTVENMPSNAVMVIAKAADLKKVSVVLEPTIVNMQANKFAEVKQKYYDSAELFIVTKDNKNYYLTSNATDSKIRNSSQVATLFGIQAPVTSSGKIKVKYITTKTPTTHSYWANSIGYSYHPEEVVTDFDITEYSASSVWLVCGDFKARVFTTMGRLSGFVRNF